MFYLLALLCAVGIGSYRIVQQNIQLKNHEERIFNLRTGNGMGTGVYAIRDIKVGEMVTTTDIETRPIAVNKMPDHMTGENFTGREVKAVLDQIDKSSPRISPPNLDI
jgi:hypothetical protein